MTDTTRTEHPLTEAERERFLRVQDAAYRLLGSAEWQGTTSETAARELARALAERLATREPMPITTGEARERFAKALIEYGECDMLLDWWHEAQAQTAAAVEALRQVVDWADHGSTCKTHDRTQVSEGVCDCGIAQAQAVLNDLDTASARFIADVEKPYITLLERLRKHDHDRHDTGSDEQRARGDYGPTPVETCQNWFCYHVGVYIREYERRALLATTPSAEGTP